jgi:hypothetical protein
MFFNVSEVRSRTPQQHSDLLAMQPRLNHIVLLLLDHSVEHLNLKHRQLLVRDVVFIVSFFLQFIFFFKV